MDALRRLLAEAAGTFILVFGGAGAIVVDARSGGELGHFGISMVFGLAIAAGVFAMRAVSGAHFNPAISVAMAGIRRFAPGGVAPYVGVQLAGAVAAAAVLRAVFGNIADLGATVPDVALWKAFAVEIVITAFLAFVIARVAADGDMPDALAAVAIGGAVALGALVGGPLTGGSMNPARSFGPALVALEFSDHWLYWLAPPLGALIGAFTLRAVRPQGFYTGGSVRPVEEGVQP